MGLSGSIDQAGHPVSAAGAPSMGRRVRRVLTAPGLRFVALGAALFVLHALHTEEQPGRLVVSRARQAQLGEQFRLDHGRAPNEAEQRAMIEQWATEEALFLRARELDLVERDTVVRKRLVQDMEFLLEAQAPLASEQVLRAYYDAHQARYRKPETRTFEHVFVAGPDASTRARSLRQALLEGKPAKELGDPSVHGPRLEGQTRQRLANAFGDALAASAFELEPDTWSAPLESVLGTHLLRVVSRTPSRPRPFEEVRDVVRQEQAAEARESALRRGRRRIRGGYELELLP